MANPEKAAPMPDRRMPSNVRGIWDHAYDNARRYYRAQNAPEPDELSKHTAWRVLNVLGYRRKGTGGWVKENPGSPIIGETAGGQEVTLDSPPEEVPTPGQVAVLGKLVELAWIDGNGRLQVVRFNEPGLPDLLWQDDLKVLLAFPGVKVPAACLPPGDYPDAAKMLKRWAQREAKCAQVGNIPPFQIAPVGAADTIVYRSDKWHTANPHPDLKGSQEYLHMFGPGVFAESARGNPPPALVVQGGELDVEERGIIH